MIFFCFHLPDSAVWCRESPNLEEIWKLSAFFIYWGKHIPLSLFCHFILFFPSLSFLFPSLFHHPPISFLYAIYFFSLISITSQSPPQLIKLRLLSSLLLPPLSHSLLSAVYPAACPFSSSFPDRHNRSLVEGFVFGSPAISHHRRGQSLLLAPTPVTIQGNSEMHGFPGRLLQKRVRNRKHSVFHTDERSCIVLILTLAFLKNNDLIKNRKNAVESYGMKEQSSLPAAVDDSSKRYRNSPAADISIRYEQFPLLLMH